MPSEFYFEFESNQNSFKIDVYSFGVTLYFLLTEIDPFENNSSQEIITNTLRFTHVSRSWRDLIESCWRSNPNERPDFVQIRKLLESKIFVNKFIDNQVFNNYKNRFK